MEEEEFNRIGQKYNQGFDVEIGQMFGKSCLKSDKKAFAAFYKGEMVFKIGQKQVDLFLDKYSGSQKWDPSGKKRPMKDWLQVPSDFIDQWNSLAEMAFKFINDER